MNIHLDFPLIFRSLPFVLQGLPYTLGIAFSAFLLGNVLALLLLFLSYQRVSLIKKVVIFYISFFRGIPAIVLLFFLYFGFPKGLSAISASILCFTITSSAFLIEIYRGCIQSISSEQWDAGLSLGFSTNQVFWKIIFPQAYPTAIPSLSNVAIDLVKGTAITAMITVPDLFQQAKIIGGRSFDYLSMFFLVGILYWTIGFALEKIQYTLERKMKKYENTHSFDV